MRDQKLDILFEPLKMPNLTLKNRFFMAPMGTTFHGEQLLGYLAARAKGGVAMITTAAISVHPSGRAGGERQSLLETDEHIRTFSPMIKTVKNAGAAIVAQIGHFGRYSPSRLTGRQPVAPSPIASKYTGETPRELSTQEVDELVMAFAEAALRARKAGFDGIELLGNSGYLISQFLSPLTNKREDKYGGDVLQRGTFLFSVLRETRRMVGDDYNLCVKFDAEDGIKGGKTLEDSVLLAPHMEAAGADRLHIWAGWHESPRPMLPMFVPRAGFRYMAAAVSTVVGIPVATVCRINEPYLAADIIQSGDAAQIGLGRPLLCDPDFVNKTLSGRVKEIRRCTACCYCFDQMMGALRGKGDTMLKCALNPELGRETEQLIQNASKRKKILVVGGGPAGMEVARVAALRGHAVTLFEKESKLGGMINLACIPPSKDELKNIIEYYEYQMALMQVDVHVGQAFTSDMLDRYAPDEVVIASGAVETVPPIPGVHGNGVVFASDVLGGRVDAGGRAVIIGGGLIGLETAEFLADRGSRVTVLEALKSVGEDIGFTTRWGFLPRVYQKVEILTLSKAVEILENQVVVEDPEGNRREVPADIVVLATGLTSTGDIAGELEKRGRPFHRVGSCRQPGQIPEAISEAFGLGRRL